MFDLTKEEKAVLFDFWYGKLDYNEETAEALNSLREKGLLETKEVWKPVVNWEEYYEVSSLGRVRNIKTGKVRKQRNHYGYNCLSLSKKEDGERIVKTKNVHRLVAEAFLDNPSGLPEVNHIDENKTNNALWNLEWISSRDNVLWSLKEDRTNGGKRPVAQLTPEGKIVGIYQSIAQASKTTGISRTGISRALNGESRTAGGFIWIEN